MFAALGVSQWLQSSQHTQLKSHHPEGAPTFSRRLPVYSRTFLRAMAALAAAVAVLAQNLLLSWLLAAVPHRCLCTHTASNARMVTAWRMLLSYCFPRRHKPCRAKAVFAKRMAIAILNRQQVPWGGGEEHKECEDLRSVG